MRVKILGVPFDANSSYMRGSAQAPPRIREALFSDSTNMWTEDGVDLGATGVIADSGDIELPSKVAPAFAAIENAVAEAVDPAAPLICLGGDHSVTYPIVRGFHRHFPNLTILHFDAHPDLNDEFQGSRFSHACQFARAPYCQRFGGQAAFGKDHVIRQTFYGFRLHLRTSREGVVLAAVLAPANAPETEVVWELEPPVGSLGIGDRGYWSPALMEQLAQGGIRLLAPYKRKGYDPKPQLSKQLRRLHWLIETVNGQLAGRFQAKRTWAKDLWHLCSRVLRKVLSHTVAAWVNVTQGRRPLDFAAILDQ